MVEQHIYDLLPAELTKVIGDLPGGSSNCIAIMLYDGPGNEEYFAMGTIYKPVVKIVVRNQSYEEAQRQVVQIRDLLHKHKDDFFMSIMLVGYPLYLGRGEQKLHEFQVVFNITTKE